MAARIGSLGSVLPVAVAEPDGLIVTTDGRYVRVIECDRVPNTITADPSELGRIEDCFAHLCRIIPDRQGLTILAQTDPVPIDDALAADVRAAKIAAARDRSQANPRSRRAHATDGGHPSNGPRRCRCRAAGRRGAVVGRRALPAGDRRQPRAAAGELGRRRGRTLWETHVEAAIESQRLADQIDAVLRRAGIDTWLLDGTQALALLWERLHPAAELTEPEQKQLLKRLADACQVAYATTPDQAAARHRVLEAIASRPALGARHRREPGVAASRDGTLEETIHLATPPLATDPSWLAHLLSCPLPATLAVHIASVCARGRSRVSGVAGSGCAPRSATRIAATGSSAQTKRRRWPRRR